MDTPVDGLPLPVASSTDVLAILPVEIRRPTIAPVRDALAAALTEILLEYQRRATQSAGLSDILRASGRHLEGLAADHGVFKQPGESTDALRLRTLTVAALATPERILSAVNTILAPFTSITAKYFESEVDCWFVDDGTSTWSSHVFNGVSEASPHYADRLYPDDEVENGGDVVEEREVLGAWAFADGLGRYFVLRLPPIQAFDDDGTYAFSDVAADDGMFVADGSDTSGAESDGSVTAFIFEDQTLSDEVYAAIVSTVELLRGQSMRWQAYVDPLLS